MTYTEFSQLGFDPASDEVTKGLVVASYELVDMSGDDPQVIVTDATASKSYIYNTVQLPAAAIVAGELGVTVIDLPKK